MSCEVCGMPSGRPRPMTYDGEPYCSGLCEKAWRQGMASLGEGDRAELEARMIAHGFVSVLPQIRSYYSKKKADEAVKRVKRNTGKRSVQRRSQEGR